MYLTMLDTEDIITSSKCDLTPSTSSSSTASSCTQDLDVVSIPQTCISLPIPPKSRKMEGNKSRKGKKSRRVTPRSQLSFASLSKPAGATDLKLELPQRLTNSKKNIDPIVIFFEALSKVQTCLFLLRNTVARLRETLKNLIPRQFLKEERPTKDSALNSVCHNKSQLDHKMVSNTLKVFVNGKIPPTQFAIENNNTKSIENGKGIHDDGKEKLETIVPIPQDPHYPSSSDITDSSNSNASIVSSVEDLKSQNPFCQYVSSFVKRYVGIIFAIAASICMSLVTLIVKLMESYSPVSKVIWRLQGVLLPSLLIVLYVRYYQKRPLIIWKKASDGSDKKSSNWRWRIFILLVIRGLVGCSADIFQYYSLKYLPLADSTVISFSTPIFVCIVAHFLLGEKFGIVPIFTAVLTLCGVIVISKPPILTGEEEMNSTLLLGNTLALLCMMCATFTTVIMRCLQHVHFAMTMLALGIFGTLEGLIVTQFTSPFEFPSTTNCMDWVLATLIAGLFFLGQLSMTLALQKEEAGVVSLVRTCDVLFAFTWQVLFLQQEANILSYIGAIIVTCGVCITALRKWVSELPEHSPVRSRLFFILR